MKTAQRALPVAAVCTLVLLVAAVTAAVQTGLVSAGTLAASPLRLARGEVWLLVSNGTFVQRPVVLSLMSFGLLSLVTFHLCGTRVFAAAALAGHVGSTLLAYAVVGLVFVADRGSVRGVVSLPDYGVSAMQAAWIGAVAVTLWRRRGQTALGRAGVAFGCVAVAAFAWIAHSHLTLLDLDHVFAFAIGAGFAAAWAGRAAPELPIRLRAFAHHVAGHLTPPHGSGREHAAR